MNRWQILRIALALAGIFAAGVVTGRFTAPAPAPAAARPATGGSEGGPIVVRTGEGQAINSAQVIRYYTNTLKLTPAQKAAVIPLIRRAMYELQKTAPGAPERLEFIRGLNAKVRQKLDASQQKIFDSVTAEFEADWLGRHGTGNE